MADIDIDRLQALYEKERKSQYLTNAEVTQLRNALPALLAEVRALRAEHEKTEAALRRLSKWSAIFDHIRPSTGVVSQVRDLGLWREPKETL